MEQRGVCADNVVQNKGRVMYKKIGEKEVKTVFAMRKEGGWSEKWRVGSRLFSGGGGTNFVLP